MQFSLGPWRLGSMVIGRSVWCPSFSSFQVKCFDRCAKNQHLRCTSTGMGKRVKSFGNRPCMSILPHLCEDYILPVRKAFTTATLERQQEYRGTAVVKPAKPPPGKSTLFSQLRTKPSSLAHLLIEQRFSCLAHNGNRVGEHPGGNFDESPLKGRRT